MEPLDRALGLGTLVGGGEGKPTTEFITELIKRVKRGVRSSKSLPSPEDHQYFKTIPEYKEESAKSGKKILELIERIGQFVACNEPTSKIIPAHDELSGQFIRVKNVSEMALESVDLRLDAINGRCKLELAGKEIQSKRHKGHGVFFTGLKALGKPQKKFKDYPIDNSKSPFIPKIKIKHNSVSPLPDYGHQIQAQSAGAKQLHSDLLQHALKLQMAQTTPSKSQRSHSTSQESLMPHPYKEELELFRPVDGQTKICKEQMYGTLEDTPCEWIDTERELKQLVSKLKTVSEFAVDLEHHSYRSYQGFTCLMQISTRKEDFLIDTLALRHFMYVLNDPFTDPKIVKVLHGADSDIVWLQKDFGIYVVNMFDTGQASRVLELPRFSLLHLLHHYCGVNTDKKYQLADWRQRPIPAEMLLYARQDTHYLLYIFDRLRNSAFQKGGGALIKTIISRSTKLCQQTYQKPVVLPEAGTKFMRKYRLQINDVQLRMLQGLLVWRDTVAREADESIAFVLPNRAITQILTKRPTDSKELLQCCQPVPPMIRDRITEVLAVLQYAEEQDERHLTPLNTPFQKPREQMNHSGISQDPLDLAEAEQETMKTPTTDDLYERANWVKKTGKDLDSREIGDMKLDGHEAISEVGPQVMEGIPMFDMDGISDIWRLAKRAKFHKDALQKVSKVSIARSPKTAVSETAALFALNANDEDQRKEKTKDVKFGIRDTCIEKIGDIGFSSLETVAGVGDSVVDGERPTASAKHHLTPQKRKSGEGEVVLSHMVSPESSVEMPRSIREIYHISNSIRNKNKSRDKEGNSRGKGSRETRINEKSTDGLPFPEAISSVSKGKNEQSAQNKQFMRDIGWLGEGAEIPISRSRPSASSRSSNSRQQGTTSHSRNRPHRHRYHEENKPFDFTTESGDFMGGPHPGVQQNYDPYKSYKDQPKTNQRMNTSRYRGKGMRGASKRFQGNKNRKASRHKTERDGSKAGKR